LRFSVAVATNFCGELGLTRRPPDAHRAAHELRYYVDMRALLVTLVLATSGCFITPGGDDDPIACTLLYTEGGLAITINPPPLPAPNRYRLQVRAAADTLVLHYDLAQDGTATCVEPCEDTGAMFVMNQGLSLPNDSIYGFVTDLSRSKGPVTAVVQVFLDTTEVYQQQVTPMYRTTEPNGPGCGEVSNADFTATLP